MSKKSKARNKSKRTAFGIKPGDCQGCGRPIGEIKKAVPASELLRVADDYLEGACEVTVRAHDASSRRGTERIDRALDFMFKVRGLLGEGRCDD